MASPRGSGPVTVERRKLKNALSMGEHFKNRECGKTITGATKPRENGPTTQVGKNEADGT